jgi:hypothetical protein
MRSTRHVVIASTLAACVLAGAQAQAANWAGDLKAGAGYWAGNATYSIGGEVRFPYGVTEEVPDKISELEFPLDVAYGSLGGSLSWNEHFEIHGTVMASMTDPSTKATDSDWGVFPGSGDNTLDIYSESDAELTALSVDVGMLYYFAGAKTDRLVWSVGAGPSLLYQHLDWSLSNFDQGYPSQPWLDHDFGPGVGITYKSDIVMPYLNVSAAITVNQVSGRLEFGVGPAFVQDEDDHVEREIIATADMTGLGLKGAAEIRFAFTRQLFALASVTALSIEADGTSKSKTYGDEGGDSWKIDEEFSLSSINGGLSVGYAF